MSGRARGISDAEIPDVASGYRFALPNPNDIISGLAWAGGACGLVLVIYWTIALARMARTARELPTARDGLAIAADRKQWPSVAVVIPAHNEARVIGELIASLRGLDYPRFTVTLALDRCTDGTADAARTAIAGDERFRIVEIASCEPGWSGKVHAAHIGTQESGAMNADLLLFADADTLFDPGCLRACVALLEARNLDMLSLLSTMRHERWYELLVQPVAGLELVKQYPLSLANERGEGRRAFANGQFMLFRRDCYARFGGHHEVRRELLEDLRFAQILEYYGMACGVLLADGMLICRMYDTWGQFVKGWKRIYTEAAHRKPERLMRLGWRVRGSLTLLPAGAIAGLVAGSMTGLWWFAGLAAAGLVLYVVGMVAVQRLGRGPAWAALATPIGGWVVGGLLIGAGRDLKRGRGVEWAGMTYDRRGGV
jgi:chlorobactene glucosyltransferase